MLSYCLKCTKNTESKNTKFLKTKNRSMMLSSNCTTCGSKKLRVIKEQEASRILSILGINIPFSS